MSAHPAPGKPCSERALAQRERILAAAKQCFVEHGFHAAGMALIAQTAGMSPGLIYRYFDSKNAIILAIVERQLEVSRAGICALRDAKDFAQGVFEVFNRWLSADPDIMNAALFLEMSAEAGRDPQLRQALADSDREVRKEFVRWLSRSVEEGGLSLAPDVAEVRALGLQCFVEGLAVRALREPDVSPQALKAAIANFLAGMLASGD